MLELKKGVEILAEVGGVKTISEAKAVIEKNLDPKNLEKLSVIKNEDALVKIANAIAMCEPDDVFVNTGSEDDRQWIREYSLRKGEEAPLAKKGHTIHFDLPQDQARLVNQTFYIVNEDEKISALAKKVLRSEGLSYVQNYMKGIMKGKVLMIGFYSRGPVGAQASIPAIEMSSSTYVLHSAELLYRNIYADFDKEADRKGVFFTNVHSEGPNRPEDVPNARIFMDRSWLTTYSTFCTYAGNTLLMKKGNHRFAVDYSTYYKPGEELSEHMFITGMTGPGGRKTYFAGAAPSGCGKTTTAMVGTDFVGDDLAQMWRDGDGIIRSINPECGIFGIVEDVNREGDPYLMDLLRNPVTEVIWSNVLIDDNGVPQWVGNGEEPPEKGFNFQGPWKKGMTDANGKPVPLSHPNARCTVSASALANYSAECENPRGVETRVITYSGRDSDTMPPVWVAKTPDQGVAIGACIVSAATATEVGATGVKRAPWANAPFIPGSLGGYMKAQFEFFNHPDIAKDHAPIMAGLNYFLTDEARGGHSRKLLGEKRDVKAWLSWMERRVHGEVAAIDTPIGYLPLYEDLEKLFRETIDKAYSRELYNRQFTLYLDNILARVEMQIEAYGKEENIPPRLFEVLNEQKAGLQALKEKFGPVVTPEQLLSA